MSPGGARCARRPRPSARRRARPRLRGRPLRARRRRRRRRARAPWPPAARSRRTRRDPRRGRARRGRTGCPRPSGRRGSAPLRAAARRPSEEWRSRWPLRERLSARVNLKLTHVSALRIEREGPVLRVTLARPERRNAFDAALIGELTDAFSDVGDARGVVLAGEGEIFCAGADVEWQRASIDLSYEENVEDAARLARMMNAIDGCPAPLVVRVQGFALGGGSGLVACADVAVASTDAVFGFSEVKLGIIPAVISPFVLAKIGAH